MMINKKMKQYFVYTLLMLNVGMAEEVYATFNVNAVQDSKLTLDSSGIVDKINVDVGDVVKQGDVLLNLSNDDKVQNVNMQKSQNEGYKEQSIFARKQYERYKRSGSAIDKNTLEQNYSNYKNLDSSYNASNFNILYNQALLDKTILKAPFDGVIASKNIELGDGVSQNNTVLFRLVSSQKKLILQFDSKYIAQVKVGSIYKYKIDGAGQEMETRIYKIYPTVDSDTRKVSAEAIAPSNLQPGLFGDGYIDTTNQQPVTAPTLWQPNTQPQMTNQISSQTSQSAQQTQIQNQAPQNAQMSQNVQSNQANQNSQPIQQPQVNHPSIQQQIEALRHPSQSSQPAQNQAIQNQQIQQGK